MIDQKAVFAGFPQRKRSGFMNDFTPKKVNFSNISRGTHLLESCKHKLMNKMRWSDPKFKFRQVRSQCRVHS